MHIFVQLFKKNKQKKTPARYGIRPRGILVLLQKEVRIDSLAYRKDGLVNGTNDGHFKDTRDLR